MMKIMSIPLCKFTLTFSASTYGFRHARQLHRSTALTSVPFDTTVEWLLQFDGGSRGNPGPSGAGAVLYQNENGTLNEKWCGYSYLGDSVTNNVAEYKALILGLKHASTMGLKSLVVQGDSELVIRQVKDEYRVGNEKLVTLHTEAKDILRKMPSVSLMHIPRDRNSRADELSNIAMNLRVDSSSLNENFTADPVRLSKITQVVSLINHINETHPREFSIIPTVELNGKNYILLQITTSSGCDIVDFIHGSIEFVKKTTMKAAVHFPFSKSATIAQQLKVLGVQTAVSKYFNHAVATAALSEVDLKVDGMSGRRTQGDGKQIPIQAGMTEKSRLSDSEIGLEAVHGNFVGGERYIIIPLRLQTSPKSTSAMDMVIMKTPDQHHDDREVASPPTDTKKTDSLLPCLDGVSDISASALTEAVSINPESSPSSSSASSSSDSASSDSPAPTSHRLAAIPIAHFEGFLQSLTKAGMQVSPALWYWTLGTRAHSPTPLKIPRKKRVKLKENVEIVQDAV